MLQAFPFLPWIAITVSGVLLGTLWREGELGGRQTAILAAWFVVSAWCQFLGPSAVVSATGLALQTVLAIDLIVRWKLSAQ